MMRMLFMSPPNLGAVFGMVPLAQAAVAAGHDVLFGTCSTAVPLLAQAGLNVVDVAPDGDFAALLPRERHAFASNRPDAVSERSGAPHFFETFADLMLAGSRELVARWRPDLVVHTSQALVARHLGVPTLFHGIGFLHHPDMVSPWLRAKSARRRGICDFAVNVSPPSMSAVEPFGRPMRYIPYSGGGALPDWLFQPLRRSRIAVTLGTVAPRFTGTHPLQWILDSAGQVDAEFVFALGGADPAGLGRLPANVRAVAWLPLDALVRTCTAVVHHGGAGSIMASLDAGLPQLVLPQGADQFDNTDVLIRRGVGVTSSLDRPAAEVLCRLLDDERLAASARQVQAEMAAMPTPAETVSKIAQDVGSVRTRKV
ncbi:nucleotide disphospho-sugar-binding domain-containing protein [Streptomyces sp. NPDC059627]